MFVWLILGCSVKSGVAVWKMDQQYAELNTVQSRSAQFEWAMAEEYRDKAREEYASSQFEDAEDLATQSIDWMNQAVRAAEEKNKQEDEAEQ
jgi:hypothetical protein